MHIPWTKLTHNFDQNFGTEILRSSFRQDLSKQCWVSSNFPRYFCTYGSVLAGAFCRNIANSIFRIVWNIISVYRIFRSKILLILSNIELNKHCVLRRFYTRRNVSEMSRRHRFFCSFTCVKVLFTDTFLKCRFR